MYSRGEMFWCIFVIVVVMNTTHFAFGQYEYEPLFMRKSPLMIEYDLIYDVQYDVAHEQFVVIHVYGRDILLACPWSKDSTDVVIQQKISERAFVIPSWKTPIKSRVFMTQSLHDHYVPNAIGFLLFTPNEKPGQVYVDVPESYSVVELIQFKYNETLAQVQHVRYKIGAGKFLTPEISTEDLNKQYEKDEHIFNYDLDQLYEYSQTKFSVVKVSLAPEEDFFFSNWKTATRHNILTAPMWRELLPQWQALEIFTRKVAQIIDVVKIRTGVYHGTDDAEKIYLDDSKHPIPKYFWKTIYIEVMDESLRDYVHGILFVMHNVDPKAESNEQKICPNDDVSKTGWQFLPDTELKSLMYGCLITTDDMKFFQERPPYSGWVFDPFDLHDLPAEEVDDEGELISTKRINVLDEMEKLEKAKKLQ